MVFNKIKDMISSNKESKELSQFTARQRERIFDKISRKEEDLLRKREDNFIDERIRRIEGKMGISEVVQSSGRKRFREQRLANLERQKKRTKDFFQKEQDFRDGKLEVRPVGPKPKKLEKKMNTKLNVKEIKLRSPPSGI